MDTARGNQTLSVRFDEVLAAWEFIDPLVDMATKHIPLIYRSGSMGPTDDLLIKDLVVLIPQRGHMTLIDEISALLEVGSKFMRLYRTGVCLLRFTKACPPLI